MLSQTYLDTIDYTIFLKLFVKNGPTLHGYFSYAVLAQADQDNIAYGYFPTKRRLCGLAQHCTGNFLG